MAREPAGSKLHGAANGVARLIAVLAALVTVLEAAHSFGLDGSTPTRRTVGTFGAAWVGLIPAAETAAAIGDTLHLAATVTDKHGTALVGATIVWSSEDPAVATVIDGAVVARGVGTTRVVAAVGERLAHATVVVHPVVKAVEVGGDSAFTLAEGQSRGLVARASDARGYVVADRRVSWTSSDTTIATIDSAGRVSGITAGHTTLNATVDGVLARTLAIVTPVPGALVALAGANQDGPASAALPERVIVRVLSLHGHPIAGVPVHFRRMDASGTVDLTTTATDADGRARATWRLGDFPGRQHLLATADGLDTTVTLDAEAEPVTSNTRTAAVADSQHAQVGTGLPIPVGIRLTDSAGRALAGVPVTWLALSGGSIGPVAHRTDSLGVARAAWALGPAAGVQLVRALIGNGRVIKPVVLHATALPDPAVVAALAAARDAAAARETAAREAAARAKASSAKHASRTHHRQST
jgi:Big-like domain-containing protein